MTTNFIEKVFRTLFIFIFVIGTMGMSGRNALAQEPVKVGLITMEGGISDMSFNWLAFQGFLQAETDLGIDGTLYEPATSADYADFLQQCVDDGNELCIGVGFGLGVSLGVTAKANPDTKWGIIDYSYPDCWEGAVEGVDCASFTDIPNVRGIKFHEKQVGYLAGALAGMMTGSNVVGVVGGIPVPAVVDFAEGYRNGAQCANPNVNVLLNYTNTFIDPDLGATVAEGMIAQGTDVVFGAAGPTGNGAILYSAQHDVWSIGVDSDQYLTVFGDGTVEGSDKLLTSAMKKVDYAVYQTIDDLISGAFSAGTVIYQLQDGGVGLAPYHETDASIPQSVKDYVESVKAGIIDGSINIDEPCRVEPPEYYPSFSARLSENEVHGYGWLLDSSVTLTIDDPANGVGIDYTDTRIVMVADWDPNQTFVLFRPWQDGFQLQPGQLVTLTDGMKIKSLVVANLTVTNVDLVADTVSGTADPGTQVDIGHIWCDQDGCFGYRRVYANENGDWIADFAHVGEDSDEQDIVDLVPGMGSEARQCYSDGCTTYGWRIPDPRMTVSYEHDWISINDFTPGGEVTYTIYDYPGGHALFGPVTGPVDSHGNGWISSNLFRMDLIPGNYITAVNEATGEEISVLIRDVNLDYIGTDDNIVFGTAEPNTTLRLNVNETNNSGFNLTVDVDDSGYWEVNLADAGYPISGYRYAGVDLLDEEGDSILAQSPWIDAEISTDNISVTNFSKNADVTFTVYESPGGAVLYGPDILHTNSNGSTGINLWYYGIDLVPGNYIVAYDHQLNFTKALQIEPFDFQEMNAAEDTVTGTAAPGEWVDLNVESLFSNWGQQALTNESGQWFRDYGAENYDITEQMWANGWTVDEQGNRSHDHTTGLPSIEVSIADDRISGFNFSPERLVRIRIYDSPDTLNPTGMLLMALPEDPLADIVVTAGGDTRINAEYWQHGVDIQPGMYILAEDLETGKSTELTIIPLTFDGVDYDADTAWGTSEPGATVIVQANHLFDNYETTVVADEFGNWLADFSAYGADITPDWDLSAKVYDLESDSTIANAPEPPVFTASLNGDWLNGNNWTANNTVTINIYEFVGGLSIAGPFTWGTDNYGDFYANLWNEGVDLQPANYITVTDDLSGVVKTLSLPNLTIDVLDPDNDLASGQAPADTRLRVEFNNQNGGVQFDMFSGLDGTWQANFAAYDFDLTPGSNGSVRIIDNDGDAAQVDARVFNPNFNVRANNDQVEGWEWNEGDTITLTIDDPDTIGLSPDYTGAQMVGRASWDPSQTYVSFNLWNLYDIQPGDVVSLSDGSITKTTIVTALSFTEMDIDTDTVSGIATPGSRVDIWACDQSNCYNRHVNADESGNWLADFAHRGTEGDEQQIFDIVRGTWIDSQETDDDGDRTMFGQNVPNPYIEASADANWVHAREWPTGTVITMTISGSGETFTATMAQASWNPGDPNDIVADFDLQGYDLQAGDVITATGDGITKILTVSSLVATNFDVDTDTISGIGTPGIQIQICANVPDRCLTRWVTPDEYGNWTADYHVAGTGNDDPDTFDVQIGSNGWAAEYDDDNDRTWYDWEVQLPTCPAGDSISGYVYAINDSAPVGGVTVYFDDFSTDTSLFSVVTAEDGSYRCGLPEGTYRVWAGANGNYSRQYYPDTIYENTSPVEIQAGTQLSGVNIIYKTPAVSYMHMDFNLTRPGIDELAVRQAIAYGTDRQLINDTVAPGSPVMDSFIHQGSWSYPSSGLPQYGYDPQLAMDILTEAGWVDSNGDGIREKDGVPLSLTIRLRDESSRVMAAQIFAENMAEIGIQIEVQVDQSNSFLFTHDFDIALFGWIGDENADFGENGTWWLFKSDYTESGNFGYYNNPEVDQLLEAIRPLRTRAEVLPYATQIQIDVMTDLATLPLFSWVPSPTAEAGTDVIASEGTTLTLDGSGSTDTFDDIVTYQWDLDNDGQYDDAVGIEPEVTFPDNGTYTVGLQVTDAYSFTSTDTLTTTIVNIAPTATFQAPSSVSEGMPIFLALTNPVDVAADLGSLRYAFDCGSGYGPFGSSNAVSCPAADSGDLGVGAQVKDKDGGISEYTATVIVTSVPPTLGMITAPVDPVRVGAVVNVSASFTDPSLLDAHTAVWDWGDGTTSEGIVTEANGSGSVTGTHIYAAAGVYTLQVMVTDSHGNVGTAIYQYIVIYDPDGGFVTGGGWINSPAGAYTLDPTLTGKATFGFVSKYQKGANVPTGSTEFQFQVANLNFKSTSYDWLVIAGTKAQYKGTGTINGRGEYKFILTAIDGTPDKFRIKIWDVVTGRIVYDNMLGSTDDAVPITTLGGGAIVIHK